MTEVEEKLRAFLIEILQEKGYGNGHIEIQAISSGGANYTSELYLVTVSAPQKENLNLFAKVANVSDAMRAATNDMFSMVYEVERFFYAELAVAFENMYNKHKVPEKDRLYITKYYGFKATHMEETLILENLGAKGFGNFDRLKTFNWDYASKAIEELAKFHALGLAYREENREVFDKLSNMMPTDMGPIEQMKEMFIGQATKVGTEMIKVEYRDKMKKYLSCNDLFGHLEKMWVPNAGGFLIHGDYRPSNLMHRRRNGKVEVVPLDYQTYRLGSFAVDLMYFIFSGSDAHFRKFYYQLLLDHYYKELTQALKNLGIDVNNIYPRKVFDQELEEAKSFGLFLGLTMMPLLTVAPDDAPKMDAFENMMVTPNQLALDRVNDIVADYIRWGLL